MRIRVCVRFCLRSAGFFAGVRVTRSSDRSIRQTDLEPRNVTLPTAEISVVHCEPCGQPIRAAEVLKWAATVMDRARCFPASLDCASWRWRCVGTMHLLHGRLDNLRQMFSLGLFTSAANFSSATAVELGLEYVRPSHDRGILHFYTAERIRPAPWNRRGQMRELGCEGKWWSCCAAIELEPL